MKKIAALIFALMCASSMAFAIDFGTALELEAKKKINKRWSVSVEGEVRTQDGMGNFERLTIGPSASFKVCNYLKIDAGYLFMNRFYPKALSKSGNSLIDKYWSQRHRAFGSLTGEYKIGRVKLSLRERYQFTFRDGQYVRRWNEEGTREKSPDYKPVKRESVLRSRIKAEYGIPNTKIDVYFSAELFHIINEKWAYEKVRHYIGADYDITKQHGVGVYLRYQDIADSDEPGGFLVGAKYSFSF